jgi:hypothetical protein
MRALLTSLCAACLVLAQSLATLPAAAQQQQPPPVGYPTRSDKRDAYLLGRNWHELRNHESRLRRAVQAEHELRQRLLRPHLWRRLLEMPR